MTSHNNEQTKKTRSLKINYNSTYILKFTIAMRKKIIYVKKMVTKIYLLNKN